MATRNWRDADLGNASDDVPKSVGAVVRRTQVALRAGRIGESVLFGAGAFLLTLAALIESGGEHDRWDARFLALIVGAFCALAWKLEHRDTPLDVARALDQRLRHQGGLITAFEVEGSASPLARLVAHRVLRRLRSREAVRALFPSLALPLAAPLFGAGMLVLALDGQRAVSDTGPELGGLAGGMVEILDGLERGVLDANDAGALSIEDLERVTKVARRSRALERRIQKFEAEPELAAAELADIDRELSELADRLGDQPELRRKVEEARNWVDAARMQASASARQVASTRSTDIASGALASASPDGTMVGHSSAGPDAPDDGVPVVSGSDPNESVDARDSGTSATSFWPPEYDAVVAGWVELRRHADQPND